MKNWEDAEEVTQDVLMKVFRKIDAFRGDAALSSWIYRITFNTAMSRLRTAGLSRGRRTAAAESAERRSPAGCRRTRGLVVARRRSRAAARDAGAADHRADDAAGGVSHAGDPARHPGAVDRGSERGPQVKPQTLKSRLHRGRLILRKHLADFAGGVALHTREAVN